MHNAIRAVVVHAVVIARIGPLRIGLQNPRRLPVDYVHGQADGLECISGPRTVRIHWTHPRLGSPYGQVAKVSRRSTEVESSSTERS